MSKELGRLGTVVAHGNALNVEGYLLGKEVELDILAVRAPDGGVEVERYLWRGAVVRRGCGRGVCLGGGGGEWDWRVRKDGMGGRRSRERDRRRNVRVGRVAAGLIEDLEGPEGRGL